LKALTIEVLRANGESYGVGEEGSLLSLLQALANT